MTPEDVEFYKSIAAYFLAVITLIVAAWVKEL